MIRFMMLLGAVVGLTGCAGFAEKLPPNTTPAPQMMMAQINSLNQACDQQYTRERLTGNNFRYSHWAQCRRDSTMALEKTLFPHTKHLVQLKYDTLVSGMDAVARHETTPKAVLKRVNEINAEYNRDGCPVEYFGADAHPQCDAL